MSAECIIGCWSCRWCDDISVLQEKPTGLASVRINYQQPDLLLVILEVRVGHLGLTNELAAFTTRQLPNDNQQYICQDVFFTEALLKQVLSG
jgi:hypothetical protein